MNLGTRAPRRCAHLRLSPGPHATWPRGRTGRSQRGVTVVEAAFALPILFSMLMALTDFGMGVLQTSQVSGAAADGARTAIIWRPGPNQPDVVGSTSHQRVRSAVAGRLMGREFTFEVSCLTPTGSTLACSAARPDRDRLKVVVRTDFQPVSPIGHTFAGAKVVSSSATMGLTRLPDGIGSPVTSTPPTVPPPVSTAPPPVTTVPPPGSEVTPTEPPPVPTTLPTCVVTSVVPSTSVIDLNGNNPTKVKGDVSFTVTTSGNCGVVTVTVGGRATTPTQSGFVLPRHTEMVAGEHSIVVLVNGYAIAGEYFIDADK